LLNQQKIVERIINNVAQDYLIYNDRCVFLKHKKSDCNLCINYCPTEAIRLNRITKKVSIDPDKCIGCSICTAICPTEVFIPTRPRDQEILNTAKALLKISPILEITCAQIDEEEPDRLIEIKCLGSIHNGQILGLIALGAKKIHFRHADCSSCETAFGNELITRATKEVEIILAPFQKLNKLTLSVGANPVEFSSAYENVTELAVEEQGPENISRREFLTSLIKKSQQSVAYSLRLALRDNPQSARRKLKFSEKYIPAKRKLLLAALNRLDQPDDKVLDVTNLTTISNLIIESDKCSVCPSCANFCPTGALTRTEVKDKRGNILEATLYFNESYCTKCGLCLVACFTKAIKYDNRLRTRKFLQEQPRILQEKNQEIL